MFRRRQEFKVYPEDTKINTGIGIKFPFNITKPFVTTYSTRDQLKSNLMIFALTNRGERFFNMEFGSDIRSKLFEQMSDFEGMKDFITERINYYFPQINDLNVEIMDAGETTKLIKISYSFNGDTDNFILQA